MVLRSLLRRLLRRLTLWRRLPGSSARIARSMLANESWMREELADEIRLRQWVDRAVVLAYAVLTGAVIVAMTLLVHACTEAYDRLVALHPGPPWALLAWTPLAAVAALWWGRRWCPGALGSGIPQVMRACELETGRDVSWLVSLRISLHKVALISLGTLGGLSIGREGPAVQVGAGVMAHAHRWLHADSEIDLHDLMVAGAAAGIAASFNTPLGGIVFALETLSRRHGLTHSTLVIASIVLAGLVSVSTFGNTTYFGQVRVQDLNVSMLVPILAVGIASGIAGGLFARLVVASTTLRASPVVRWRSLHPFRFAAACGLAVGIINVITAGATAGTSYAQARQMLEGGAQPTGLYTLLKSIATWLSVWSGAPGGIFATSLTIGASLGHDVATILGQPPASVTLLVALGMVGFLSATTQGPVTAFIIVMEMVAGHSMVLSLMACSLLASGVARLFTAPIFEIQAEGLRPPGARDGDGTKPAQGDEPLIFPEARR